MIEWITFKSPKAIVDFPMGDSPERTFPVYLPPNYDPKSTEKYPVAFLLAGFSGRGSAYLANDKVFDKPLHITFDRAIKEKRMRPLIVVFPDCSTKLGGSQFVNSPANGNYMDYLCDELVAFIDSKYRTLGTRATRILHGHSSGGFGAMVTAMLRPDAFAYYGSSAGDTFYEVSFLRNINFCMMELAQAGTIERFVKTFLEAPSSSELRPSQFEAMLMFAMAPCYAPNLKNPPLYGDVFFDLETGEIIPEIWEKYLAWDPVRMVDKYVDNLKKISYFQLEAGLSDEHGLQWGHRQVAKKFEMYGIPHEIKEYPGRHGGHHWRFESRLIRLLDKMFLN